MADQKSNCPTVPRPKGWDAGTENPRAGTALGTPLGQRTRNIDVLSAFVGTALGTLTVRTAVRLSQASIPAGTAELEGY